MMNECSFKLEKKLNLPVCGLDEAGRGPLAGPVVAACVYVSKDVRSKRFWAGVNDSKKLNAAQRETLFLAITEHCHYGIAQASVLEIDTINILQASMLAMRRSYALMLADYGIRPGIALVDGNFAPKLSCETQTVIKGDAISLSIAAASILAKVTRDRLMQALCTQYPGYGWATNAGYGTKAHLDGLKINGVTPHHRRSFSPVREALLAG